MSPKIVTFSISCRTFWWPNCISNLPFFFFSKWSRTCLALKVNWVNQELHKTFYSIRVIKNCLTEKTSTQFQSLSCERKNMPPSQSNITILSNSSHKWLQHKLKMCCGLLIFFFFFLYLWMKKSGLEEHTQFEDESCYLGLVLHQTIWCVIKIKSALLSLTEHLAKQALP